MSLRIHQVPAARGVAWVKDAFALFFRHPLGFTLLFLLFLVAALVMMALPLVGALLLLAAMPLLTLGFASATRAARQGQPVHAGHLVEALRGSVDPRRRNALLRLCALYAGLTALCLLVAQAVDGGGFERLQVLVTAPRTEATQREIDTLMADGALRNGLILRVLGLGLLSVPFWHAPMLVAWNGQPLAQALFSSALACWRNRAALFAYLLVWMAASAAAGLVASVLAGALGAASAMSLALPPLALMLSVVFYVSLYAVYADSFAVGDEPPSEAG
jgi:hypothetical protein